MARKTRQQLKDLILGTDGPNRLITNLIDSVYNILDDTDIGSGGVSTPQTIAYSATPTFNFSVSSNAIITLTGNITTLTMQNVPDGGTGSIKIIQDATGSAFGINALVHTGLTFKYLGGIQPIGSEINGEANGETEIIYKRMGSVINISFGLFN